jgi:hypothetical protein
MGFVPERPTLEAPVQRIRDEIQAHGESTVSCERLRVLCAD